MVRGVYSPYTFSGPTTKKNFYYVCLPYTFSGPTTKKNFYYVCLPIIRLNILWEYQIEHICFDVFSQKAAQPSCTRNWWRTWPPSCTSSPPGMSCSSRDPTYPSIYFMLHVQILWLLSVPSVQDGAHRVPAGPRFFAGLSIVQSCKPYK